MWSQWLILTSYAVQGLWSVVGNRNTHIYIYIYIYFIFFFYIYNDRGPPESTPGV